MLELTNKSKRFASMGDLLSLDNPSESQPQPAGRGARRAAKESRPVPQAPSLDGHGNSSRPFPSLRRSGESIS